VTNQKSSIGNIWKKTYMKSSSKLTHPTNNKDKNIPDEVNAGSFLKSDIKTVRHVMGYA
jgi:hypothetical protein